MECREDRRCGATTCPRCRDAAAAFLGDFPATAAATVVVKPSPYALPLCRYEGIVLEYAACGCEDKHVRWCDHPEHGADIDRCHRGPVRGSPLTACETCAHRAAPGKTDV